MHSSAEEKLHKFQSMTAPSTFCKGGLCHSAYFPSILDLTKTHRTILASGFSSSALGEEGRPNK
jgi:hypothetical protein